MKVVPHIYVYVKMLWLMILLSSCGSGKKVAQNGSAAAKDTSSLVKLEAGEKARESQYVRVQSLLVSGNNSMSRGASDSAVYYYTKVLELDEDNADALAGMGNAYFMIGQFDKAVTAYKDALKNAYAADAEFYKKLGFASTRINQFPEAVMYLSQSISLDPTNVTTYAYRGFAALEASKFEMAEKDYSFILKKNKNDVIAWYNLGRAQYGAGNYAESIKSWQQALKLEPNYLDSHFKIGLAYATMDDFKNAIVSFDKAIEQSPTEGYFYYNRGVAKGRLSPDADYCKDFRKATELGYKDAAKMIQQFCKDK